MLDAIGGQVRRKSVTTTRLLQERLCKPLRMVDTGFSVPPQQVITSCTFLHS